MDEQTRIHRKSTDAKRWSSRTSPHTYDRFLFLAHQIGISEILPCDRKSYLTDAILSMTSLLCYVTSSCEIAFIAYSSTMVRCLYQQHTGPRYYIIYATHDKRKATDMWGLNQKALSANQSKYDAHMLPEPKVIKLFSRSNEHESLTAHNSKRLKTKSFSCF